MDFVLIPAYEPDEMLIRVVEELARHRFGIVVVDDGSGEGYAPIFEAVKPYATVVTHEQNRGKGAALKTGMSYIRSYYPEAEHVITCDADGQHKPEDVKRVSECLAQGNKFVLTVRQRRQDIRVPLRSKFGNSLSRIVFALLTNRYLSDNQSGLRGFKRDQLDWLIQVEGHNYDYEMNVLYYAAKKNIQIATIPIEALYIDNNSSSHFSPVKDTLRIYRSLFYLARGTFVAFGVVELGVILASILWSDHHLHITVPSLGAVFFLSLEGINRYIFFKHTRCYDQWSNLIYTVISYFVYTLFCMLFAWGPTELPLWLSFNITYLICMPLRYYLHKFIFVASQRRG